MSAIAGIIAIICIIQGNFGGAIVAIAIGLILEALSDDN